MDKFSVFLHSWTLPEKNHFEPISTHAISLTLDSDRTTFSLARFPPTSWTTGTGCCGHREPVTLLLKRLFRIFCVFVTIPQKHSFPAHSLYDRLQPLPVGDVPSCMRTPQTGQHKQKITPMKIFITTTTSTFWGRIFLGTIFHNPQFAAPLAFRSKREPLPLALPVRIPAKSATKLLAKLDEFWILVRENLDLPFAIYVSV